jgi:hypothetical protein
MYDSYEKYIGSDNELKKKERNRLLWNVSSIPCEGTYIPIRSQISYIQVNK